jgi:hypothetical protein
MTCGAGYRRSAPTFKPLQERWPNQLRPQDVKAKQPRLVEPAPDQGPPSLRCQAAERFHVMLVGAVRVDALALSKRERTPRDFICERPHRDEMRLDPRRPWRRTTSGRMLFL